MHEMQTIVTDVCGVCPSVCISRGSAWLRSACHLVQPLSNHFGLLFFSITALDVECNYLKRTSTNLPLLLYLCL